MHPTTPVSPFRRAYISDIRIAPKVCGMDPYEEKGSIGRYEYLFASPSTPLDYKNPQVIKNLEAFNRPLLLYYYRRRGEKERAIKLLLTMRKQNTGSQNIRIIEEIVYTYIYFNDYEGAKEYLKYNEISNPYAKHLSVYMDLCTSSEPATCSDPSYLDLVLQGLLYSYHEYFIRLIVDFYKRKCGPCLQVCLKAALDKVYDAITSKYVSSMSYEEAKYLYKTMPQKARFLHRMMETNPSISYKYYKRYAKIYGIKKEDIERMLSVNCSKWVLLIACSKGWIDPSMEGAFLQQNVVQRPFINAGASWRYEGSKKHILFMLDDPTLGDHKK